MYRDEIESPTENPIENPIATRNPTVDGVSEYIFARSGLMQKGFHSVNATETPNLPIQGDMCSFNGGHEVKHEEKKTCKKQFSSPSFGYDVMPQKPAEESNFQPESMVEPLPVMPIVKPPPPMRRLQRNHIVCGDINLELPSEKQMAQAQPIPVETTGPPSSYYKSDLVTSFMEPPTHHVPIIMPTMPAMTIPSMMPVTLSLTKPSMTPAMTPAMTSTTPMTFAPFSSEEITPMPEEITPMPEEITPMPEEITPMSENKPLVVKIKTNSNVVNSSTIGNSFNITTKPF